MFKIYNTKLLQDAGLEVTDENIFIVAACGDKGLKFLQGERPMGIRYKEEAKSAKSGSGVYTATIDGKQIVVEADGKDGNYTAKVNGKSYKVSLGEGAAVAAAAPAAGSGEGAAVTAPLPGNVLKVLVNAGDQVSKGDTVLILEAVKMENEIKADCDGTVGEIKVSAGSVVSAGDVLMTIN